MKANIVQIDKGKKIDVDAEVFKLMSKTLPRLKRKSEFVPTCHHCHVFGHIMPIFPKLKFVSTSKVRPPSRKPSSPKTTHVCHHCDASGHTHPNHFKLFPHRWVFNRSHPSTKGSVPILGELLKVLSYLTQFQINYNSFMSFSRHTRTCVFSSSLPKTCAMWVMKDPKT